MVFLASPDGERRSARRPLADAPGADAWTATYAAFNGDFAPGGEWQIAISYPDPEPPSDAAAGMERCAGLEPATIHFNW